tara:strand:- start:457 stop:621 length:165 start_codon:yes stop_codon:yes gene_type:complete
MTNKLYKIEEEATSGWSLYENYRHLTKEQAQEKISFLMSNGINPEHLRVIRDDV